MTEIIEHIKILECENLALIGRAAKDKAKLTAADTLAVSAKVLADYVATEIFASGGESIEQMTAVRKALRQYREAT